jgi:hypothetical protein
MHSSGRIAIHAGNADRSRPSRIDVRDREAKLKAQR